MGTPGRGQQSRVQRHWFMATHKNSRWSLCPAGEGQEEHSYPLKGYHAGSKRPPGVQGFYLSWGAPKEEPLALPIWASWEFCTSSPCTILQDRRGRAEPSSCGAGRRVYPPWWVLSTCREGLGPGRKFTPFLVFTHITSGVRLSPGSRLPGTCRAPASPPLTHSLPLGPYLPLYGEGSSHRRGGEDKGRSPAASLPQLPASSQVAAASSRQVRQPSGTRRDHR